MEIKELKQYPGYGVDKDGGVYCRRTWRPIRSPTTRLITGQTIYFGDKWRKLKASRLRKSKSGNWQRPHVSVSIEGRAVTKGVHKLVALAFHPNPYNLSFVCHKDGDPSNNHADNLYWGTPKQNQQDRYRHGTVCYGTKNRNSKLTEGEVWLVKRIFATGKFTKSELAKAIMLSESTLGDIVMGVGWPHVEGGATSGQTAITNLN